MIVGDLRIGAVEIGKKMRGFSKNRHGRRYRALFSGVLREV